MDKRFWAVGLLFVVLFSSAFAAVKLPAKEPDIITKTAQLDKASVVLIYSIVTGTAAMPDFKVVEVGNTGTVEGGNAGTIVGTWQTTGETLTLTEDNRFSAVEASGESFSGVYSVSGNALRFDYVYPQAGTVVFTFSLSGNTLTLSNVDVGDFTYTRVGEENTSSAEGSGDIAIVVDDSPTAKLLTYDLSNGAGGTGLIVSSDGYIVTNAHVVLQNSDPEQMLAEALFYQFQDSLLQETAQYYKLSEEDKTAVVNMLLEKFIEYFSENGQITKVNVNYYVVNGVAQPGEDLKAKSWTATVKKVGVVIEKIGTQETWGKDIAILKVEKTGLPAVTLGDSDKVQVGESVFVMGFPGLGGTESFFNPESELEATVTRGVISAKRTLPNGLVIFQSDAAINHGNSGGPVYNDNGEVIGIATFISGSRENVQDIGFLLPINIAKEFMSEINVQNKKTLVNDKYKAGLEAFWKKDCSTAINELKTVLTLYPSHPYAQEYITECERAIAAGEVSDGSDIVGIMFGLVLILIVLAGIAAILLFVARKVRIALPSFAKKPENIEEKTGKIKYCAKCGTKLKPGEKFCDNCGTKVSK